MNKLDRLIREAKEALQFRGHVLTKFRHDKIMGAVYICPACESPISVIAKPRPNECELMGDALAVNCIGSQLAMYKG